MWDFIIGLKFLPPTNPFKINDVLESSENKSDYLLK